MSRSSSDASETPSSAYELGWVTIHRLLREGASWSGRERNKVFANRGDGTFADVSGLSGIDFDHDARAAVRVDWDDDGREDLVVSSRNSPRVRVLRNVHPEAGRSVSLWLEGTRSNRDAIGARIEVHVAGEPVRLAAVRCGEGYLAQSSRWIHVGLGAAERIERVVVRWPRAAEDRANASRCSKASSPAGDSGSSRTQGPPSASSERRSNFPRLRSSPTPARTVHASSCRPARRSRPASCGCRVPIRWTCARSRASRLLVVLFAQWCAPCLQEMRALAEDAARIEASGLRVLAVGVDEPEDRTRALEVLTRMEWPFATTFAGRDVVEALDALQQTVVDRRRRLGLPTAFLVDAAGDVAVVYRGPAKSAQVQGDLALLGLEGAALRDAAVPFPGRWIARPPATPPLAALERAYDERGLELAGADVSRRQLQVRTTSEAEVFVTMGSELARLGRMEEAAARFADAVASDPSHVTAQLSLTVALHQLGRVEDAVAGYKRVLRLDPRNSMALYNLGLAHAALGQLEAALSDLASLEALNAESADRLRRQLDQLTPPSGE